MREYVVRRVLLFFPSLAGVSLVVFALMRLVPGDVAEILVYSAGSEQASVAKAQVAKIRSELGLDKPIAVQYALWLKGALQGNFGHSYLEDRPVREMLAEWFPRTMELALLTLVLAALWAVPLGVVSAVRQDHWPDYLCRSLSISGLSVPIFFSGVLILFVLVRFFHWLPPLEYVSVWEDPARNLQKIIWPALAQAFYISAPITRLTRSQLLEVIREDYVRTARSKGLIEQLVIYRHALKNALLPVVTFTGWWVGRLLGGLVVMEIIFQVPGMGMGLITSVNNRDYPTVQAIVFVMAGVFLLLNLIVDLLYGWLDPRIKYA